MVSISQRLGLTVVNCSLFVVTSWVLYKFVRTLRNRSLTTKLRGPRSQSLLFGVVKSLVEDDPTTHYERWTKEFGNAYQIPGILGSRATVILDPKAVAYFFSKDAHEFRRRGFESRAIKEFVGEGLLYAEGDNHKRQRKALSPAFSASAVRDFAFVFFDSAHKVKTAWTSIFEANEADDIVVDVQVWMNRISMDSLGIAGFSHDFESLHGKSNAIIELFDTLAKYPLQGFGVLILLLTPFIPILRYIPSKRREVTKSFRRALIDISETLLQRSRAEKDTGGLRNDTSKSIIGTLVQSESTFGHLSMTPHEVLAQMEVLIVAGYETTSISMTWAFIELCRHPEVQAKLRKELAQTTSEDPTYDQLIKSFPYLDAVMREVLRLYPPLEDSVRVTHVDEIIPLAYPIETAKGEKVDFIPIAKDEIVIVPVKALNVSQEIWGEDAKEFKPERWLDNKLSEKVRELPGYNHLLTFIDGTRMCIGRNFAIAEFKAVLAVLVKNYEFEFRGGRDSIPDIEIVKPILPRPKLRGEVEIAVPLRIRRIEAK